MPSALATMLLRRLLMAIPLMAAVITLTFFFIRLAPGDPATIMAGDAPTPEFLAQIRSEYGFDQPLWTQFMAFVVKAAVGDFGTSLYTKQPVFDVILERFPATVLMTGTAMVLASLIGILLGVASAKRAGSRADSLISAASLVGYSVPGFWIGQLLILLFAVSLNWFPVGGMIAARASYSGWRYVQDVAWHMVLPVTTLAVFLLTMIARFTRAAMIEALDQDYVLVAEAKGASRNRVLWHHAFRNASVTTVTVIGLEFGAVLAGAVVVEIVYSWPGLGRLFYDAIFRRDFPLLTGAFMFSSFVVIAVNTASDVICALLDPPDPAMTIALTDLRRPSTAGVVGALFVTVVVVGTVLAPLFTPYDPLALSTGTLLPPSLAHPLGTDDLGRDGLARVLYGGRVSLGIGLFSAAISVIVGMTVGMVAGFFGGALDEVLMRITEAFQILPKLLVAVVVVSLIGSSLANEILVIGLLSWPATARVIRGRVQVIRHEEFIAAAEMSGASWLRVLVRHVTPNVLPLLIVSATLQVASAIMSESFLSFLGLGDPAHPSWGLLLQQGQLFLRQAWWLTTFPGLALAMTILGLNLLGDGARPR